MVFIRINWTLCAMVFDTVGISIPKTFKASVMQRRGGVWVLENGFSTEKNM
jgi:hypothetical protein